VPDQHRLGDAIIAATALDHQLTLATQNIQDFLNTGVQIENPWEPGVTYAARR
jgi:predicted nucleic acid-binding protein